MSTAHARLGGREGSKPACMSVSACIARCHRLRARQVRCAGGARGMQGAARREILAAELQRRRELEAQEEQVCFHSRLCWRWVGGCFFFFCHAGWGGEGGCLMPTFEDVLMCL